MASPAKHLEQITAHLEAGEQIIASATAHTDAPKRGVAPTRGTLVVTNQRFIFFGNAWGATGSAVYPLSQVAAIDLHKNLMVADLQVMLSGGSVVYHVKYNDAKDFAEAARGALARSQQAPVSAATSSDADELAKFAALHQQGVLSDEEFATAKARILS